MSYKHFKGEFNSHRGYMDMDKLLEELRTIIKVPLDNELIEVAPSSSAYDPGLELLSCLDNYNSISTSLLDYDARISACRNEIEKARQELAAIIREKESTIRNIETEIFDKRRKKREYYNALHTAEIRFRQALENEKLQKDFLAKTVKFDEITAGLSWRELAYPHQIEGAKLLATAGRAILGDKMGLGKTLTSLIACDMLQVQKVLVVVPDDVVSNFVKEIQHWTPHRQVMVLGKLTKLGRELAVDILKTQKEFIAVINYSAWRKDKFLLDKLVSLRFEAVILDEAHLMKEVTTSIYMGCKKIVLSENSCPKCRKNIQSFSTTQEIRDGLLEDRKVNNSSKKFFACIGDKLPIADNLSGALLDLTAEGCGWSQIADIYANVNRKEGEMRSVRYVFTLTGTPILNKPTDLFAMLSLIDPTNFAYKYDFNNTYCDRDYQGRWVFKSGGLDRLTKELSGKYIARDRKSAGVILPKQEVIVHNIELDEELYPKQSKVIKDLSRHMMVQYGDKVLPILFTISLILRKRQANVWPGGINLTNDNEEIIFSVGDDVNESIKLDRLCGQDKSKESEEFEGLIPDITGSGDIVNGERVVVFSQFKTPLIVLESRLKNAGIAVVRFDGDTPPSTRDEIKIDFDSKYCNDEDYNIKWQVVLCNYKTGGVGLNFTGASQMIILDEEWNPGKVDQAYGRIDRIGQTKETTVHVLRIDKTIDTWMASLIESKRNMIEGFENNSNLQSDLFKALMDGDVL